MKKISFSIILFLGSLAIYAQIYDPVKWQSAVENLSATGAELKFTAVIEAGWSMYAIDIEEGGPVPTSFAFKENPAFELIGGVEQVTKPDVKLDPHFNMNVGKFNNLAVFKQKIRILKSESFVVNAEVEFMCCDDKTCIAPKTVDFDFKITPPAKTETKTPPITENVPVIEKVEGNPLAQAQPNIETEEISQDEEIHEVIVDEIVEIPYNEAKKDDSSIWAFFLMAILAGLGGALTPCVYPMIPMTVSFFMRDTSKRSVGIVKALIFGLSIILVYSLVGVLVALTKRADLVNALVSHWLTNLIFAGLFIAFALSFFGLFELSLGSSLANKMDKKAEKGGYISAFFMAMTLVIVSFSCTGPFVGGILVASTQGLAIKPILGMFGFGLAFALPFTLLAFFPSMMKQMPKSGGWMNSVKIVFAFVMMAFTFYFLSSAEKGLGWNIITRDVFLCIWIVLAAFSGFYLIGKIRFESDSETKHVGLPRLFFATTFFVFALYLFTGLIGAPLNAVAGLLPAADNNRIGVSAQALITQTPDHLCGVPRYSDHPKLKWSNGLRGYFDYDDAIACAKEKNKPVLMIFKGHGCAKCREMEATVWTDYEILRLMNDRFILLALYTDDNTPLPENEWITSSHDNKIKKTMGQKNADFEITHFHVNAFPYYVVLNTNGETIGEPMGYTSSVEEFKNWLMSGLDKF